jgi:hypothetical protein
VVGRWDAALKNSEQMITILESGMRHLRR